MDELTNLTRLEVENFQSIEYVSIPFNQTGVHWISGMPNVGKSAILKAIQALYKNISNFQYKEMIRDGEDFFRVKGYFGNDDWVELVRGEDDQYRWSIDGNYGESKRTQGKVPFEVKEFYHLYWTGDKINRYLNFTLVGDPLFFVETTQGDNTLILEKALGTDRLTRVGKYSDSKKREVRSELRTLRKFYEESGERLEDLTVEVNEGKSKVELLDRLKKAIDKEVEIFESVEELSENTHKVIKIAEVILRVENELKSIDVSNIEKEIKDYGLMQVLSKKETKLEEVREQEERLVHAIKESDIDNLGDLIKEYDKVIKVKNRLEDMTKTYQGIKEEEDQLLHTIKEKDIEELSILVNEYAKVKESKEKIERLTDTDNRLKKDLEDTVREYRELEKEKEEFLSQFEVCPFCERPMEGSHAH